MRRLFGWIFGGLCLALVAGGCGDTGGPTVGSESHFLTRCPQSCGAGFECLCGVCTARCTESATCTAFVDAAECVAVADRPAASACTEEDATAFCDVRCTADPDCASLGADFACTDGFCRDDAGGIFSDGRVELAELCAFYVADVCRVELGCYGSSWKYRDQAHCEAAKDCAGQDLLFRELTAERVTYDPAATAACHQRLLEDPCAHGLFLTEPTLPEALAACGALTGLVAPGETCEASVECVDGNHCDLTAGCPGACVESPTSPELGSVPLGGACTAVICVELDDDPTNDPERCTQCATGLTCYDGTCRPDWGLGEACTSSVACQPYLWCDTTAQQCTPLAAEAETCTNAGVDAPPCAEGLFCYAESPFALGVCTPLSAEGGPCVDEYDCLDDVRCIPDSVETSLGTCHLPAEPGTPCTWDADCTSDFCATDGTCQLGTPGAACTGEACGEGLSCLDGLCVTDLFPGDACPEGIGCQGSRCVDGICSLAAHLGEACAVAEDCLSARCEGGLCTDAANCPLDG